MNKLRENTAVILWILVLSFGVIWTLQDSNVFEAMNQSGRSVATVNGTPIDYSEYQTAVKQQRQQLSQQVNGDLTPRMEEMMRQRAYDQVINNQLLEQQMNQLGITVTDPEIEQMVFGENPHPLIRRQFADSSGQINYQLLRNMAQNPEAKQQWLQLEQFLRKQRRQQKMSSLIQSTVYVSEQDIREYHQRQNTSASAEYVALRYASVPNDSISVTESDLRSYYENNKEDFKRDKTVTLEYVTLSKEPTAEDTAAVAKDLKELRDEFANAENDSLFLAENASERSFTSEYQTPNQMVPAVADAIFKQDPSPGTVIGPVFGSGLAHLVKVRDTKPADQEYLHARHILLKSNQDDASARKRLQAIKDSIQSGAASFAEMARKYSDDQQSASEGGDLGWFGEGQMAEGFNEAAFSASPGELVGPVQSEFGYHLIKVEARASEAVQIADLAFNLTPSQATLTEKENTLEDILYYTEEGGSFEEEAQRRDLQVQQVQVEADESSIPGIGQSAALTSFLKSAEAGALSDVVELDDKFVVARAANVQPEGYRSFEEVKAEIRPRVQLQKKKDIQVRRMRQALQQNEFEQLPEVLNTELRSQSDVTFSTESVPGLGRDPTFAGTVFGLDEGETSGVVEGENAAYVVRVTNVEEPPELTASRRKQIRQQLLKQRRKEVSSQWFTALRDEATIEDNRSQFQ